MPSQVSISASIDGNTFTDLTTIDHDVVRDDAVTFKTFGWEGETQARYIRYQAERSHFGGFLIEYEGEYLVLLHNTGTEEITFDISRFPALEGMDLSRISGFVGMGSAKLSGTTLTLGGQTSVVIK